MDKNIFLQKFAEAIDVDASRLNTEMLFRSLREWDSLAYLSVIAMLDEEYDIQIELQEFKNLLTLQSIMDYIVAHK